MKNVDNQTPLTSTVSQLQLQLFFIQNIFFENVNTNLLQYEGK